MIRITEGQYLAVTEDKMIEIHADTKEKAEKIAWAYFDEPYIVCQIPSIIGYIGS